MKKATLFALICTMLLLLYQASYFLSKTFFNSFWEQLNYRAMSATYGVLFILFLVSLANYFWALYKRQKS
jgi:hypothetical protein